VVEKIAQSHAVISKNVVYIKIFVGVFVNEIQLCNRFKLWAEAIFKSKSPTVSGDTRENSPDDELKQIELSCFL